MPKQLTHPPRARRHRPSAVARRYEVGGGIFFILRHDGSVQIEMPVLGPDETSVVYETYFDRKAWDRVVVAMSMAKLREEL